MTLGSSVQNFSSSNQVRAKMNSEIPLGRARARSVRNDELRNQCQRRTEWRMTGGGVRNGRDVHDVTVNEAMKNQN